MRSYESLKESFDNLRSKEDFCIPGGCEIENEETLIDYPSYTDALYAIMMAPVSSGVYISRWDLKEIAQSAGESMAIHPRKRMFELLMKYASDKETMQLVLDTFQAHIEEKIAIYEELASQFSASKEIFESYILKANKIIEKFPTIIKEYF
ncbi:MAG: hypothetical protein JXQ77_01350 [Campylobacterales bacterium]|nr:hypothetical protein [Campylobacterales bacterium]